MRLPVIEPGTILQAILRDRSLLFEKKVGLNHFEVIKKIGAGGFSIVYLGIYLFAIDCSKKKRYRIIFRNESYR
jgi:hypothetical protein